MVLLIKFICKSVTTSRLRRLQVIVLGQRPRFHDGRIIVKSARSVGVQMMRVKAKGTKVELSFDEQQLACTSIGLDPFFPK
jgi:hypothetical protein